MMMILNQVRYTDMLLNVETYLNSAYAELKESGLETNYKRMEDIFKYLNEYAIRGSRKLSDVLSTIEMIVDSVKDDISVLPIEFPTPSELSAKELPTELRYVLFNRIIMHIHEF